MSLVKLKKHIQKGKKKFFYVPRRLFFYKKEALNVKIRTFFHSGTKSDLQDVPWAGSWGEQHRDTVVPRKEGSDLLETVRWNDDMSIIVY